MLRAARIFSDGAIRFVLLLFVPAESLVICILHFSALWLRTYLFELLCQKTI